MTTARSGLWPACVAVQPVTGGVISVVDYALGFVDLIEQGPADGPA